VPDGAFDLAVVLAPAASTLVQEGDGFPLLLVQARPEDVDEQVVVPLPLALVVQREEEQVGALQPCQRRVSVVAAGDGVAQGPGEPVEDGGAE
jgi:hypothetical protein